MGNVRSQLGQLVVPFLDVLFPGAFCVSRIDRTIPGHDTRENCPETIIITRRVWIELVIVATSTIQRNAEECLANGAEHVFQFVPTGLRLDHSAGRIESRL